MSVAARQLPLDFGGRGSENGGGPQSTRRERRERIVRMVEYGPFPRVSRDQRSRIAFTRDESTGGMCLAVDRAESVGELTRIIVRGVDGRPTLDCLARVAWCNERADGRYWIGLAFLTETRRRLLSVRHTRRSRRVAVNA